MTKIPTVLTLLRMVGAVVLLFVQPLSAAFFVVYTICGLSDAADGYLARRFACTSRTGALLDSLADLFFIGAVLIRLLSLFTWPAWLLWWVGVIALLRLLSFVVGVVKYHCAAFLHTCANKATGLVLFGFPLLYLLVGLTPSAIFVCVVATLASAEELVIHCRSSALNRDTAGLLCADPIQRGGKPFGQK